jgi:hypothetical protein
VEPAYLLRGRESLWVKSIYCAVQPRQRTKARFRCYFGEFVREKLRKIRQSAGESVPETRFKRPEDVQLLVFVWLITCVSGGPFKTSSLRILADLASTLPVNKWIAGRCWNATKRRGTCVLSKEKTGEEHNKSSLVAFDSAELDGRMTRGGESLRGTKEGKADADQWLWSHGLICLATRATANNAALVSPVLARPFPPSPAASRRIKVHTSSPPPPPPINPRDQ